MAKRGRLMAWFFGKPKVGETKSSSPEMVLIEFVCMEPHCDFQTLSLTDAQTHIQETLMFGGGSTTTSSHRVEPRGYYYKKEPL